MQLKRVITCDSKSYSSVLKRIRDDLLSEGKDARINKNHKCVDVFDGDDEIVEQHYPEETSPTSSRRGKFVKVGPGLGDYILTKVNYNKRNYTYKDHLVKYVNKTNKDHRAKSI